MKVNKKEIEKIAKKYNLKLVLVFGSQAKGKLHPKSDLDLAFYPEEEVDEQKLYEEFVHLFKRTDIDLVNLRKNHNHFLRYQILSEGLPLYEAKFGLRSKMEWQSYFDYTDFAKYYNLLGEMLGKRLKKIAV